MDLPDELSQIHNNFHVSQLRKFLANDSEVVLVDDIQVDECMNYVERPIETLDRKMKTLCDKVVDSVKVQLQHRKGSKLTWEPEENMREHYPDLFAAMDFEDDV